MKYTFTCPKCGEHNVTRKIIGTEFETVCDACGHWDSSDQFKTKD